MTSHRWTATICALAISSTPGPPGLSAGRQDRPAALDRAQTPKPAQILAAAADAIQRIRSASYDASFEAVFPQSTVFTMRGVVDLERGGSSQPALPGRVHIKSDGTGGAQEVSFDGSVARRLVRDKKLLTEGRVDNGAIGVVANSSALVLLAWDMLWAEPLKYERAAVASTYLGLGLTDGVMCHVIDLQYQVPGTDVQGARWWFSVKDDLPRRFQKVLHTAAGPMIQELRISNLRLGNGIAASDFRIDLPEGYSYQPFVPGEKPKAIPVGQPAPEWVLFDHLGKQHRLSDHRGEIVVLNFWASWCGYSKLGIPAIQKIHEKYNAQGVKVFGVSFQEFEGADPAAYLRSMGAQFVVLLNGETVATPYRVRAVPAYYVIDQEGRVAYAALEYNPELSAQVERAIERLLRGPKGDDHAERRLSARVIEVQLVNGRLTRG